MRARFDSIFLRTTGFATLDRLLQRLHANKAELLIVLDHPEIPLHTNGSENDIRCQMTKRQVSGGTKTDTGRDCRDAFLGLGKTCKKLCVLFWDYLGARLRVPTAAAFHAFPGSSAAALSLTDRLSCPGFCPAYLRSKQTLDRSGFFRSRPGGGRSRLRSVSG
jgi:Transposase IS66 family